MVQEVPNGRVDGGGLGARIPMPLVPFALPKRNARSGYEEDSVLNTQKTQKKVLYCQRFHQFLFIRSCFVWTQTLAYLVRSIH
jgi:hypothetical protein